MFHKRCFMHQKMVDFLVEFDFLHYLCKVFFIKQDVMHTEKQQAAAPSGSQRSGRAKDMRMAVNVNSSLKCQGNVVR